MANGFEDFLKQIRTDTRKSQQFDAFNNRVCDTCKYNNTLVLTSYPPKYKKHCELLKRDDMEYCSKWLPK